MIRKRNVKCIVSVLTAVSVVCSLYGCGSTNDGNPSENAVVEEVEPIIEAKDAQAGEDLDVVEPSAADDKWYMQGNSL